MNPSYSTTAPPDGVPASSSAYAARSSRPTYAVPQQSCSCPGLPCVHWLAQGEAGAAAPPQQYKPVYVARPQGPLPKPPQPTSTAPPAPTWADVPPWARPATKVWDDLYINAGVLPRVKDGMPARLPHEWTWEHHYSPLERGLLRLAEDNNASQRHMQKELERILGVVASDLSFMKEQLNCLERCTSGLAAALHEGFSEREAQYQWLQHQQTKTIDALADIVQVLSGAKNAPVSTAVENEDDFSNLPPLLDPATGELAYSDKEDTPAGAQQQQQQKKEEDHLPLPLRAVEQPHLPASSPEEAAARQQWNDLLQKDGAKAWELMEKVALGPNPPAAGRESRDAVLVLARAEEMREAEGEKDAEKREKDEEEEPFEPVDLQDLASSSSSSASTCTLDANASVEAFSSATVEQDTEQDINAPDSSFAASLASSSSTVNFVSPSSPVTADATAEKIEQVLAEMHLHAGGGKKRTRSVFEVFGTEQDEKEEEETLEAEPAVEPVVDTGAEDEEEAGEEEDDETRLLRLQLQLLETKLQFAKAMKQRAEERH